jgi:predicted PurR-regulated permease PerM
VVTIHLRLRTLIYFGLIVLVAYIVLTRLFSVVLLLLVSLIFLATLEPLVDRIERSGLPRGVALLAVMLIFAAVITVIGILVVPPLIDQVTSFLTNLPDLANRVRRQLEQHGLGDTFSKQLNQISVPSNLASRVLSASSAVAGFLATAGTILIITTYLLIDARRLDKTLYDKLPRKYHHHARYMLANLQDVVGGYIRGQATTSALIAIFTFVLLLILRVPNPLPLALIAALGDVVPVIGIFVIIVPLSLAALTVSVPAAIIVVVAMAIYIWLENNVLFPNVYGQALSLPPLAVFLAVIIGGKLLGFAGAILSLPIASGLVVITSYIWDVHTGRVPLELEEDEPPETVAAEAADHNPVVASTRD